MSALEAVDVCVEFPVPRKEISLVALWDFSLTVERGEFVSIVGPSGCGKTTFLNVAAGLLEPTTGAVLADGTPIDGPSPERSVVFQEYGLFPWRTVLGNIRFGPEIRHERGEASERQIQDAIDLVGLGGFESSYPYELSGGMRQRVGLARALVNDPDILLLDEPFGALDAITREVLQREFEAIFMKTGKTVVLITHNIDEAIAMSDRIAVLTARPGRLKGVVPVDLPRPRSDYDVKSRVEYTHIWEETWGLVQSEIGDDRENEFYSE